jgi:cytochrome c-type biogenesis protein CcmH/NrfG
MRRIHHRGTEAAQRNTKKSMQKTLCATLCGLCASVVILILLSTLTLAQSVPLNDAAKLLSRGEPERAAMIATTHLKTRPHDANARVMLARAVLAQGKFQLAYDELRKALSINPNHIDALYYLGLLAGALSQNEYQQLYALAPNSDRVHQLLAESFKAQENSAEAETEYLSALQANPHSIEVLVALGELKREQSKFDEAIIYYTQAEQIGPLDYDIVYGLGACYTYKQDHQKALGYFRQAVRFDANSAAAHFALGNALFQTEQTAEAIPALKTAVAIEPKFRQAYFLLGRAQQKLGNKLDAQAAFKKVDELSQSELEEAKRAQGTPRKVPTKP